jgi:asparagine synthetase B (glutamine-hydrolysing)
MNTIAGICYLDRSPITPDIAQRFGQTMGGDTKNFGQPRNGNIGFVTAGKTKGPTFATSQQQADMWVAVDGRIDNQEDLRLPLLRVLSSRGITPEDASDADWVLAAYQKWGVECPDKLIGDYVFVLWDAHEGRLLMVRDPMKFRTVYYTFDGRRLAFASDPEILLEGLSLPRSYDPVYLTTFMTAGTFGGINWERTPYEAVKQIPGGWRITADARAFRMDRWWELPEPESLRYKSQEDYKGHLRSLYDLAVGSRIRTNKRAAVALSRGIDSASIAATALNLIRDGKSNCAGIDGVTVRLDTHPEGDESKDATVIAQHLGLPHHIVSNVGRPYLGDHRPIAKLLPEPCWMLGIWNFWDAIRETAATADCDVILDGAGGGELFAHHWDSLADLFEERRYMQWMLDLGAWNRVGHPVHRMIGETVYTLKHPDSRWQPVRNCPWVTHPEFSKPALQVPEGVHPESRKLYHLVVNTSPTIYGFERKLFRNRGVELLHPLWDRRIVEFSYAIPRTLKMSEPKSDGALRNKPIQRHSFVSQLPLDITRQNASISGYFSDGWCRSWHTMNEILSNPPTSIREIIDVDCLRQHSIALRQKGQKNITLLLTNSVASWLAAHDAMK